MRIRELLHENAWDDFGRSEFPEDYFQFLDKSQDWLKNDFVYGPYRSRDLASIMSSIEVGSFSRSPYDWAHDLLCFSAEQLNTFAQMYGLMPHIDLKDPKAKRKLIEFLVTRQQQIEAMRQQNQNRPMS